MPTPYDGSPITDVPFVEDPKIWGLLLGTKWGGAVGTGVTVSFSFPQIGSTWSTLLIDYSTTDVLYNNPFVSGYHGLNAEQQTAVRDSLLAWSHVANISFVEVADNASIVGDIRIAFTDGGDIQDAYAYAYQPLPYAFGGDVWLNSVQPVLSGNDFSSGANGFNTVIHELGHAIGLDHPFSVADFPSQFDSFKYTVMSYSDFPGHQDTGESSFYPTTPMLLDIVALQHIYGVNTTWHAGNDTYTFTEGSDYYETIWDAGGNDTIQYVSAVDGARIDLHAGNFSQLGNAITLSNLSIQQDDVAIAFNVVIENATGGGGNDVLIGNSAANTLLGGLGKDSLEGDAGNDTLDGGAGNDTMSGGAGNDSYLVDAAGDSVIETSSALSSDLVTSLVSFTLGANLENLTLGGAGTIDATGNTQANLLTGNGAANVLDGRGGIDTMTGGDGNDSYFVDITADSVVETSAPLGGIDTVFSKASSFTLGANLEILTLTGTGSADGFGNGLDNLITGNSGANVLIGYAGVDTLVGGAGDDTYVFDGSDTLIELAGQGTDTIQGGFSYSLPDLFENLALSGTGNFDATGNAAGNVLTGNSGNNVLDGGEGNDTLSGGAGNDTYYVIQAGDAVVEAVGGGVDTVISSRDITLSGTAAGIENLTLLAGSSAVSATGNAQNNILQGNSNDNLLSGGDGNDVLRGGQGYDLMTGGTGNDTYYVNRGDGAGTSKLAPFEDQVVEALNAGTDTVYSSMYTYTLGANVENLVLEGMGRKGFGNALNNAMTGDALANTLDGGAGNDTLNGGSGVDRLIGGAGNDSFVFDNLGGVDRVLDFSIADDTIQLSLAVFDDIGTAGAAMTVDAFELGPTALDLEDRILYDTNTGALYYDADGFGGVAAVQFALLSGAPALTAADIAVIA